MNAPHEHKAENPGAVLGALGFATELFRCNSRLMMTPLTKDQVRKLPPEQQDALAHAEVQRLQARQQLLERANRQMGAMASICIGAVCGLAGMSFLFPRALPYIIMAVIGLLMYQVRRLDRRLDALMKLLENDIKRATTKQHEEIPGD